MLEKVLAVLHDSHIEKYKPLFRQACFEFALARGAIGLHVETGFFIDLKKRQILLGLI